jgi:hypothetical protein
VCISRTTSRICSSAVAGGLTTTSIPSPSTVSSESVTSAATSTSASETRSRPVISQSIQTIRSCERSVPIAGLAAALVAELVAELVARLVAELVGGLAAVTAVTVRAGSAAHPADMAGRDASLPNVSEFQPYRPFLPPGLPPERALPAPARPRLRAMLTWTAVLVGTGGCVLLSVAAITTVTGVLGVLTGTALAAVPVFPVVAAYLWLDRYESEPASLLAVAFAWGAGVASLGALLVNTASLQAIREAGGDPSTTVLVVAPVTEEALKGAAVLIVLLLRRREFDGVVDGIV